VGIRPKHERRVVTESARGRLHIDAARQEQDRRRVPQAVEAHVEPVLGGEVVERERQGRGAHLIPIALRDDEGALGLANPAT
jgi:hypothetical protein